MIAGRPADVFHNPLGGQFLGLGFLSHLHSLMVTMSQKSSVPQAAISLSQALMSDTLFICQRARIVVAAAKSGSRVSERLLTILMMYFPVCARKQIMGSTSGVSAGQ